VIGHGSKVKNECGNVMNVINVINVINVEMWKCENSENSECQSLIVNEKSFTIKD